MTNSEEGDEDETEKFLKVEEKEESKMIDELEEHLMKRENGGILHMLQEVVRLGRRPS